MAAAHILLRLDLVDHVVGRAALAVVVERVHAQIPSVIISTTMFLSYTLVSHCVVTIASKVSSSWRLLHSHCLQLWTL